MEVGSQLHDPIAFLPGEKLPVPILQEARLGPRGGLDDLEK
jgi:hypothetical protein